MKSKHNNINFIERQCLVLKRGTECRNPAMCGTKWKIPSMTKTAKMFIKLWRIMINLL